MEANLRNFLHHPFHAFWIFGRGDGQVNMKGVFWRFHRFQKGDLHLFGICLSYAARVQHALPVCQKELVSRFFSQYPDDMLGFLFAQKGMGGGNGFLEKELHEVRVLRRYKKSTFLLETCFFYA